MERNATFSKLLPCSRVARLGTYSALGPNPRHGLLIILVLPVRVRLVGTKKLFDPG